MDSKKEMEKINWKIRDALEKVLMDNALPEDMEVEWAVQVGK